MYSNVLNQRVAVGSEDRSVGRSASGPVVTNAEYRRNSKRCNSLAGWLSDRPSFVEQEEEEEDKTKAFDLQMSLYLSLCVCAQFTYTKTEDGMTLYLHPRHHRPGSLTRRIVHEKSSIAGSLPRSLAPPAPGQWLGDVGRGRSVTMHVIHASLLFFYTADPPQSCRSAQTIVQVSRESPTEHMVVVVDAEAASRERVLVRERVAMAQSLSPLFGPSRVHRIGRKQLASSKSLSLSVSPLCLSLSA